MNGISKLPLEVRYGLMIGIFVSLFVVIEYLLGFHTTRIEYSSYSAIITSLIPIIVLYRMLKRKREESETYSYKDAFRSGLVASITSAAVLTAFSLLYMYALNPRWEETTIQLERNRMQAAAQSEAEVQQAIQRFREGNTVQNQVLGNLIGNTINGMILTAILGLVVRKKKADPEVTA